MSAAGGSSENPIVRNLVVEEGGKVLVVQSLIGDVHINRDAVQAWKRKTWRPLAIFAYPSSRLEHDLSTNYFAHLVLQLHRTFREAGYTTFTGLIGIHTETIANEHVSVITLTTNQPRYVNAIHIAVKQLWNANADGPALRRATNSELQDLYTNWLVNVRLSPDPGPIAYEFVYDPEGKRVSIVPHDSLSTAPSEYPDKVSSTSELLRLLTAVAHSRIVMAGDIEIILHSYPLSKLFLEIMDSKTFDFSKVRINVQDHEEWDYINPAADQEFGKVGELTRSGEGHSQQAK
jgi:hypothetical protein